MPFSGNTYTPPAGATNAAPGQVIQSSIWDAIFTDLATALTTLMTAANNDPTWANILFANGGFAVWQRGAGNAPSFSVGASSTQYTADRWYITTGANQASTVAGVAGLLTSTTTPHAAKIARNSGQTGIGVMTFGYPLTADEVARFRGQQVSFSGAAKAGANWSPASGTLNINLYVGTGTPGKRGGGFTNETNPLSISVNLAAGATNTAITATSAGAVANTSTQGEIQVTWTPVGTAGVDDSITLDGFCLVPGTLVQTFTDIPFEYCLIDCKKFYRKSFPYNTAPAQNAGLVGARSRIADQVVSQFGFYINFEPVEMYATAVMTGYNPSGNSQNWINNSTGSSLAASFDNVGSGKGVLVLGATATNVGNVMYIHYSADAGL